MTINIQGMREKICELGRLLFDRNLTNTVVHAHLRSILAFCAGGVSIPPILGANLALDDIGLCKFAPALTTELAAFVAETLHKKESALTDMAACVMASWHGIFSLGRTIDAAYEAVERIEGAAYILLKSGALAALAPEAPGLAARSALLKEETVRYYGKSNE